MTRIAVSHKIQEEIINEEENESASESSSEDSPLKHRELTKPKLKPISVKSLVYRNTIAKIKKAGSVRNISEIMTGTNLDLTT